MANISKVLKNCILYFIILFHCSAYIWCMGVCPCTHVEVRGLQFSRVGSLLPPLEWWTRFTLSRLHKKHLQLWTSFLALLIVYEKRKQKIKAVTYFSKFINLGLLKLHPDSLALREGTYKFSEGWANFISTTLLISVFLYELNKKMQSHPY